VGQLQGKNNIIVYTHTHTHSPIEQEMCQCKKLDTTEWSTRNRLITEAAVNSMLKDTP